MSGNLGSKIAFMAWTIIVVVLLGLGASCISVVKAEDAPEPNLEDKLCQWERGLSIPAIIADREGAGVLLRTRTISGKLLKAMQVGNRTRALPAYDVALLVERKDGTGEFLRGLGSELCGGVLFEAFELTKFKITMKNIEKTLTPKTTRPARKWRTKKRRK